MEELVRVSNYQKHKNGLDVKIPHFGGDLFDYTTMLSLICHMGSTTRIIGTVWMPACLAFK